MRTTSGLRLLGVTTRQIVVGRTTMYKAGPDELQKGLGLTGKEAQALVSYREKNGDFKTIEQLKKVPDIDGAKIDAKKDSITF